MDLKLNCEGVPREQLRAVFEGARVTAYSVPARQSTEEAWLLRLELSSGRTVEFSSAPTLVTGWQEVGRLNLLVSAGGATLPEMCQFDRALVHGFLVAHASSLVVEEESFRVEAGLLLKAVDGEELAVAAGVSPGSVSMRAAFIDRSFNPEFDVSSYLERAL